MTQHIYTKEEIEDVTEREKNALTYLTENKLTPSSQVSLVNLGDDVFGIKVQPFLQDTKYQEIVSPIQDIKKDEPTQENS
jgi:hypothetical protein